MPIGDLIVITFVISLLISLVVGFFIILYQVDLLMRKSKFEKDLKLAIKESQIEWKKVKNIGAIRELNQSQIIGIIKILDREILKGAEQSLKEHKVLVNSYLEEYEIDEPFEDMPKEIRIHMERLKEKLGTGDSLLEPLVAKIKELLDSNNYEAKKQKFYTFASLIVGILGLAYSLYTYTQKVN